MSQHAVTVPERLSDLAHEVVVEDLESIVDEILDEAGWSTLIITSEKSKDEILEAVGDCLCPQNVTAEEIS
jgi:hypothetical protein